MTDNNSSKETQAEAMKIAKATQKTGQTKAQTKLIAQGIEKGISEYKKRQKTKSREQDKKRKRVSKMKAESVSVEPEPSNPPSINWRVGLPWVALGISLFYFVIYPLLIEKIS